ncbi:MAG: polyprenol monophosphomannose synthase [Armatimonadota bacterium]
MRASIWAVTATYNEAENLPELAAAFLALDRPPRLLIVDDSSPDGTGEIAEELAAEHPGQFAVMHRPCKLGYASAHLLGIRHVLQRGAEVVVTLDADLSHDPAVIPTLLQRLQEADVVVGSRYVEGGATVNWGPDRRALSRTAGALVRLASGLRVADPTGGFRAYRAPILRLAKYHRVRQRGYAFLSELLFRCVRAGGTVGEVPITFVDRRAGRSKLSRAIMVEAGLHLFSLAWRRITGWVP